MLAFALLSASACAPVIHTSTASSDRFQQLIANSRDLGRLSANGVEVGVIINLPGKADAQRLADLAALYDPTSPTYGQYLAPRLYADRYGPDRAAVSAVRSVLESNGLTTQWTEGDDWIWAQGPADRMDRLFAVDIHNYISPAGTPFFASARDPVVPPVLRPLVAGVSRISNYQPPHVTRGVPNGGLTPSDLALAYDFKPLQDRNLDGTGETIVIWGTDGHDQKDLDKFTDQFQLPPIKVVEKFNPNVKVNSGGEEEMDIELVHAIAPGATILVYTPRGHQYADKTATFEKMVADNPGAIQSHSWGICEDDWGSDSLQSWLTASHHAADMGETIFVASGDRGGFECPPDDWSQPPTADWLGLGIPDALPYVISVGGTRISLAQDHTYYNETVWTEPARNEASTGGVSRYFAAGSWQKGPGVQNRFYNGKRMEPDVSAVADWVSGAAVYIAGWDQGSGTSQAAPIWAGITALMNQYLKQAGLKPVGFMSRALYDLAAGHPTYAPFHDITIGNNMNYPATPGYDLATGLGTPDVWNLVRDLEAYQRNGGAP